MDLLTLVSQMQEEGKFAQIARNPLAQFQAPRRRYIGAEILPERPVEENMFREDEVKFRTVVANDGTRYSPTQKKDGDLIGFVDVDLGNSDIARDLNGRQYDALIKLLGRGSSMEAMAQVANWADVVLNRALGEKSEKERWEAIVNAQVVRQGDNSYQEIVNFSNPAGHRVTAVTPWSDDTYDPFVDIFSMVDLLYAKGYMVSRIVSGRKVTSIMGNNDKVRTRTSRVQVSPTGQIQGVPGRAEKASIDAIFGADGLPPIELYDLQYRTQNGSIRFLPDDCMVFICSTGRDENLDLGDGQILPIQDTLGYYAIGRAVGQTGPGRVINVVSKTDKPPRLEGEAYQTSFPVVLEPEAIAVIKGIS
ncbi:MAG: major capsid protein [Kastovskya adunca ATA6-11-RM4]|jgi:hypothetical protein|nr:major capsid protein [Kastovskya adunca ATA6-11-RM4]